ncbi:MAG: hypothetical protein ACREXU_05260, partial [Gammaproteobacteria bacterium]
MKTKYRICVGERVGQADDEFTKSFGCLNEAIRAASAWVSDMAWPDSDVDYGACVWVERGAQIAYRDDLTVSRDGR